MLKEIIIAFQAYGKANEVIKKHKLWKWIIPLGVIYAVLFLVGMYFFAHTANVFIEWLNGLLVAQLSFLNNSFLGFLATFSGVIVWIMIILFYFSLLKYFFLIVGSPIFAYLSEKTAAIQEGNYALIPLKTLSADILAGVRIAINNMLWQTVYIFCILLVCFVPLIGWLAPLLALIIECYFYGFSMLAYSLKRHKIGFYHSVYFVNSHKGLAIGNGLIFYLMHLVPIVGWVLAPSYSIIAATLSIDAKEQNVLQDYTI